jgi:hypothetical protein
MLYIGLDIHTKHIAFCVLSEKGQLVQRGQMRGLDEVLRILKALPDRFEVCYEASSGYGHYHDLLQPLAARVLLAHPGQLRLIFRSKNKNDRNDAERLAQLLYLGETPTVHVPSLEVRTWRELINCRSQVIAKRTRAKNTVRALLRSAGSTPPKQPPGVKANPPPSITDGPVSGAYFGRPGPPRGQSAGARRSTADPRLTRPVCRVCRVGPGRQADTAAESGAPDGFPQRLEEGGPFQKKGVPSDLERREEVLGLSAAECEERRAVARATFLVSRRPATPLAPKGFSGPGCKAWRVAERWGLYPPCGPPGRARRLAGVPLFMVHGNCPKNRLVLAASWPFREPAT